MDKLVINNNYLSEVNCMKTNERNAESAMPQRRELFRCSGGVGLPLKRLISGKNELVNICIIYRYISLAVSTAVYLLVNNNGRVTPGKLCVAAGMSAAGIIGSYLYKKTFSGSANMGVTATVCLEAVAYGLFVILSGGFLSPYLWYFIGSLIIIMATERFYKRYKILMLLSVLFCFVCAFAGSRYAHLFGGNNAAYSEINVAIGFLCVSGGFYALFSYVWKLSENRRELERVNNDLRQETERGGQALSHIMDLYDTFNLFSITNPDKVMDELTRIISRVAAVDSCMLLRISLLKEIEGIGSYGMPEEHRAALLEQAAALELTQQRELWPDSIEAFGTKYSVTYVSNMSSLLGVLMMPARPFSARRDPEIEKFYFNLIGVIMKELDLQSMIEEYIIGEEQNRIASEIHDTVIQKLFSVACSLRLLGEKQGGPAADENREQLGYIGKSVESTMRELREAIYGLRWDTDEKDAFAGRITAYMEEAKSLNGIGVDININVETQLMTANQKTTFYRIICEAVNNAVRHGMATKVSVNLSQEGESLVAEIRDDGKGFVNRPAHTGGQGIKNMYRMANMLKGELLIESRVGAGTTISCRLPK